MDTPNPAPAKKTPTAPQLGDKYNIKPPVLKRPRYCTSVSVSTVPSCGVDVHLAHCCPQLLDDSTYMSPFMLISPLQLWSI